ncbi:MAG: hypothetical protein JSS68_01770 [Actinobacteria bacterium]|nr:hypothetical protein [Actinomycetota bacterium]
MAAVEAVLAVIGAGVVALMVLALIGSAFSPGSPKSPESSVIEDPAQPYREALYTAIRIQQAAQEAEHRIFTEAGLHTEPGKQHGSR